MRLIKNKKSSEMIFNASVLAVLALLVLLVFVWGPIKNELLGRQFPYASSQTEKVTVDCDEDDVIALEDRCPCDPNYQKLQEGQKCGKATEISKKNCPALCK